MSIGLVRRAVGSAAVMVVISVGASAQTHDHSQMQMTMDMGSTGWHFMQDGQILELFNHQGGSRGGDELKAPNWWMGMLTRKVGGSQLTLDSMFSLDAATVGKRGYRELFQVGEAVDGRPLIDRQHPHDLFMQLAAVWRTPLTASTGLTIAGGPSGEPALGPIAFMHRASAAENPFAPLSHHTFDSTHIAFGVVTLALDHGPWAVEGSVFNAREPDDNRWDFDFGRMDSASGRLWFKPKPEWELQASTGRLKDPEELHRGTNQRTTMSASWFARDGADFTAITGGYGVNAGDDGTRQAIFAEANRRRGLNAFFGRVELLQVETDLLLNDEIPQAGGAERKDPLAAFTVGAQRDVLRQRGFEGGFGAMLTFYVVPDSLQPTHGTHPASVQLFFRLRPPAGSMGRMWNMRMAQPMSGDSMTMEHK